MDTTKEKNEGTIATVIEIINRTGKNLNNKLGYRGGIT